MADKKKELDQIAKQVGDCQRCSLYKRATQAVPGEGSAQAEIMFIGEAPGYWEDQKGIPFVGAAGKLLDKLLNSIDLKRNEVFIGNILKHRPPNNRDPLPDEVEACRFWLDRQIEVIKPKIIATLGRFAMNKFIPGVFISQAHGRARWVEFNGKKYLVFPLYHPAAALRNGRVAQELERDFEKLKNLKDNLGKESKKKVIIGENRQKKEEQLSFL